MDANKTNDERIYRIVKYALLIFTLAFFIFAGSRVLDDTLSVSGNAKKLPIYCVDTPEKKVALSFDAAWGELRDGHHLKELTYLHRPVSSNPKQYHY